MRPQEAQEGPDRGAVPGDPPEFAHGVQGVLGDEGHELRGAQAQRLSVKEPLPCAEEGEQAQELQWVAPC
jgi:hypothetical protein